MAPKIEITSLGQAATASSDFVALRHPHDQLVPQALSSIARAVAAQPDADLIYSDEDEIDAAGRRRRPRFKPDWSPDYLRSTNYIGGLLVLRLDLLRNVGTFHSEYDLVLKAGELARRIVHVPEVLYHRGRPVDTSHDESALRDHLQRIGIPADVSPREHPGTFRVRYWHARQPLVSVIIPNRDRAALLDRCLISLAHSNYTNVEVLIVENDSRDPTTFALYERWKQRPNVRVLNWDRPFNYAAVNNYAAAQAAGELLLFLNNDIEAVRDDWLEQLVELALLPGAGAVGAKLMYPDGRVQHAGVLVGMKGVAGHPHRFFPGDHPGYLGRLRLPHNVAAVTGACVLHSRSAFEQVGGFDEDFALAFNDVDLCLKLLRAGYRNVWTPDAELVHHESVTRGDDDTAPSRRRLLREADRLREKWADFFLTCDPYFSPHFDLDRTDWCVR
ncbi:MAG: glycosyltransferase [Gemmataceae bacterium]